MLHLYIMLNMANGELSGLLELYISIQLHMQEIPYIFYTHLILHTPLR